MAQSSIEWTQVTWNPTTGCDKISTGCKFCYAEVMSRRLRAMGLKKYRNNFKLTLHPRELLRPYKLKKPRVIFVNSMSDLFHKDISVSFIRKVFKVMKETPQHTYQILTKRADILAKYDSQGLLEWVPNIWMGVSVENEKVLNRIDYLRNTKASIKFLSLEPLLGPMPNLDLKNINWVIVGGESGHKARPMQYEWVSEIKLKCEISHVAFFFKQWGKPEFNINEKDPTMQAAHRFHAKGGCQLDGKVYRQMPKDKSLSIS